MYWGVLVVFAEEIVQLSRAVPNFEGVFELGVEVVAWAGGRIVQRFVEG